MTQDMFSSWTWQKHKSQAMPYKLNVFTKDTSTNNALGRPREISESELNTSLILPEDTAVSEQRENRGKNNNNNNSIIINNNNTKTQEGEQATPHLLLPHVILRITDNNSWSPLFFIYKENFKLPWRGNNCAQKMSVLHESLHTPHPCLSYGTHCCDETP